MTGAGRRRDQCDAEMRRLAPDEVQEAPVREDLAAAVPGRAEPVAFHPPAPVGDAPFAAAQVEVGQRAVRPPNGLIC
jgi:hypothetical protein